ncbi:glycosyltransferase [Catovirus CTV1]|uniref:Glycosyltransferase n=1 Tax=Catovirus CTV1 TaxID=1977631 RepID=A0A1V0SBP5_9VIRU|nr:glycosyltransferase [Catovirus CTV1]
MIRDETSNLAIPMIIHQIWYQGIENIPEDYPNYSNSWKKYNPDYKYMFWDKDKIDNLINNFFPYFKERYNSYPKIIQKIDVSKFMILYIYGGVYVDLDSECLKSINSLLENNKIILSKNNGNAIINLYNHGTISQVLENSFLASEKNNNFWIHCINMAMAEDIKQNFWETNEKYVFRTTGPSLVSRAYHSYPNKNDFTLIDYKLLDPLCVCEHYNYDCQNNDCRKLFPNSYSMHHYGGTTSSNGWMSSYVKELNPYLCKYRYNFLMCCVVFCIIVIICTFYLFYRKF